MLIEALLLAAHRDKEVGSPGDERHPRTAGYWPLGFAFSKFTIADPWNGVSDGVIQMRLKRQEILPFIP